MYFLIETPSILNFDTFDENDSEHDAYRLSSFICNTERTLALFFSSRTLSIFCLKTNIKVFSYCRSIESVNHYGENTCMIWKPNSSVIAVGTSGGYLLLFHIEIDKSVSNHGTLLNCSEKQHRFGAIWTSQDSIPALHIDLVDAIELKSSVTVICCFQEDIMVCLLDGSFHRIRWNGKILSQQFFKLIQITFYSDLEHSRANRLNNDSVYCHQILWASSLSGLVVLLSNGRAALINTPTSTLQPNKIEAVWAEHLKHAVCMDVNIKQRLIAFGGKGGETAIYSVEEETGALRLVHKLRVSSRECPDADKLTGAVRQVIWSPDCAALLVIWQRNGFALWSPNGRLLLSTLSEEGRLGPNAVVRNAMWGAEGYSIWCFLNCRLTVFHLAKAALSVNPCVGNHRHLILQSNSKIFISVSVNCSTNSSDSQCTFKDGANNSATWDFTYGATRQWHVAAIPSIYLNSTWPIKFCSIDWHGESVAVAGTRGVAIYSLVTRRWKLFGNESQEKDMRLTCGLAWWKSHFLCMAVHNFADNHEELRVYPTRRCKLDNAFAHVCRLPCPALLLNVFRDMVLVWCADAHIVLYALEDTTKEKNAVASVHLSKMQEVSLTAFIPFAHCVTDIALSALRSEIVSTHNAPSPFEAESILVNFGGKLMMFSRDHNAASLQLREQQQNVHQFKPLAFLSPFVVATCVEIMWTAECSLPDKKYLTDALWLNCGGLGMKVWLPLLHRGDARTPGFMSRRIMLPFGSDCYALVVLFEQVLLLGATNDFSTALQLAEFDADASSSSPLTSLPFAVLEKCSQLYLNHLIKQLLRKNLGQHALELASCCKRLPYLQHALELLLHEVLEEEAASKEPIPDPLLPRVVAFVHEFPDACLDIIARCARKTELNLWQSLFSVAGSPKDLFEVSINAGQLTTAASYLLILENTEMKAAVRHRMAVQLLNAALNAEDWSLARDLIRFLKAIDPRERLEDGNVPLAATASGPLSGNALVRHQATSRIRLQPVSSAPTSPADAGLENSSVFEMYSNEDINSTLTASGNRRRLDSESALVVNNMVTNTHLQPPKRHNSSSSTLSVLTRDAVGIGPSPNNSGVSPLSINVTSTTTATACSSSASSLLSTNVFGSTDEFDAILIRHARKLLQECRLHELARFAANTGFQNLQFISWLRRERYHGARVDDFIFALKLLHEDFQWPLPLFEEQLLLSPPPVAQSSLRRAHLESLPRMFTPAALDNLQSSSTESNLDSKSKEVVLHPVTSQTMGFRKGGAFSESDISEDSCSGSLFGELAASGASGTCTAIADSCSSSTSSWNELAFMSAAQLLANRSGPPEMATRLRHLLLICQEAECHEWALLIAVVLRDLSGARRAIDAARKVMQKDEGNVGGLMAATRLTRGLQQLCSWANHECYGFQHFLEALQPDTAQLLQLVETHSSKASLIATVNSPPNMLNCSQPMEELRSNMNKVDLSSSTSAATSSTSAAALKRRHTTSFIDLRLADSAARLSAITNPDSRTYLNNSTASYLSEAEESSTEAAPTELITHLDYDEPPSSGSACSIS